MDNAPEPLALPPSLRFLKWLVIVLTITMIVGVITIVGLLVTRMPKASSHVMPVPEEIKLPDGATATAVTMGTDWIGIVTADDTILIFDRATGTLRQQVQITH